jgi:hypothetical protein
MRAYFQGLVGKMARRVTDFAMSVFGVVEHANL